MKLIHLHTYKYIPAAKCSRRASTGRGLLGEHACPPPNPGVTDDCVTSPFWENFLLDLIFFLHEFQTSSVTLQQTLINLTVNLLCTESCKWRSLGWRSEGHTPTHLSSISHASAQPNQTRMLPVLHSCRYSAAVGEGRRTSPTTQAEEVIQRGFEKRCSGSRSGTNSAEQVEKERYTGGRGGTCTSTDFIFGGTGAARWTSSAGSSSRGATQSVKHLI